MKYLILTTLLFVAISCEKNTPDAFLFEGEVDISIQNKLEQNLLNPETPGALSEKDIKVVYIIDGKPSIQYDAIGEEIKNFIVSDYNYGIAVFVNPPKKESLIQQGVIDEITTTLLYIGNDVDTIEAQYRYDKASFEGKDGGSSLYITTFWYNGVKYESPTEVIVVKDF